MQQWSFSLVNIAAADVQRHSRQHQPDDRRGGDGPDRTCDTDATGARTDAPEQREAPHGQTDMNQPESWPLSNSAMTQRLIAGHQQA